MLSEYNKDILKVDASAIRAGLFRPTPVYMITGLEIAKGFRLNQSVTVAHEVNIKAGGPITAEIGYSISTFEAFGSGEAYMCITSKEAELVDKLRIISRNMLQLQVFQEYGVMERREWLHYGALDLQVPRGEEITSS